LSTIGTEASQQGNGLMMVKSRV